MGPNDAQHFGGTSRFVPPEYLHNVVRGAPGDVWALAVTMLFIMGKVTDIATAPNRWSIAKASVQGSSDRKQMQSWLNLVRKLRDALDTTDVVEGIMYEMLDSNSKKRITAREIEARLSPSS